MSNNSSSNNRKRKHNSLSLSVISDRDAKDDKIGLINFTKGDFIDNRYEIIEPAGQGTFGTVLTCYDTRRKQRVAIKAIRAVRRYLKNANAEIRVLERILHEDVDNNSRCVKIKKAFTAKVGGLRHRFLVFPVLGCSLYEFIANNNYYGFSLSVVRNFTFQILEALKFCHGINLIHTDLKPENILLENDDYIIRKIGSKIEDRKAIKIPKHTRVKVIDFGGATFENEFHTRIVNTRQYRAPEVILGVGWSFPSDIWSVGCIVCELYTGRILFGTHDNAEHLAMMERILGQRIPKEMITKSQTEWNRNEERRKHSQRRHSHRKGDDCPNPFQFFSRDNMKRFRWPEMAKSQSSVDAVNRSITLEDIRMASANEKFVHLVSQLLCFDPKKRYSAEEALRHPFFESFV